MKLVLYQVHFSSETRDAKHAPNKIVDQGLGKLLKICMQFGAFWRILATYFESCSSHYHDQILDEVGPYQAHFTSESRDAKAPKKFVVVVNMRCQTKSHRTTCFPIQSKR